MSEYQEARYKAYGVCPPRSEAFTISVAEVYGETGSYDTFLGYQATLTYLVDGKHKIAACGKARKGDKTNPQIRAIDSLFHVTAWQLEKWWKAKVFNSGDGATWTPGAQWIDTFLR